jgi:hypothetical protein
MYNTTEDFFLHSMSEEITNPNFIITFLGCNDAEITRLRIQFKKKDSDIVVDGEITLLRNEPFNNYFSLSVNNLWLVYFDERETVTQQNSFEGSDYQIKYFLTYQLYDIIDVKK